MRPYDWVLCLTDSCYEYGSRVGFENFVERDLFLDDPPREGDLEGMEASAKLIVKEKAARWEKPDTGETDEEKMKLEIANAEKALETKEWAEQRLKEGRPH